MYTIQCNICSYLIDSKTTELFYYGFIYNAFFLQSFFNSILILGQMNLVCFQTNLRLFLSSLLIISSFNRLKAQPNSTFWLNQLHNYVPYAPTAKVFYQYKY